MKTTSYFFAAILAIFVFCGGLPAQVTIGSSEAPQAFSVLELISGNNKGLRLPQLTTQVRDSLTTEFTTATTLSADQKALAQGLQIFNTTTKCVEAWNGAKWIATCHMCGDSPCVPPFAPSVSDHTLCSGATVADLSAIADPDHTLNCYSASAGGDPIASSVALTGGSYYVSQTNSHGYESERVEITVILISSAPSQPSAITGNTPVCRNTSGLVYSVTDVPGVTFAWTVPAGWSITAGQNTNSITVTTGTAGGTISVTPSNACGAGSVRNRNITVNNIPARPSVISGATTACSGATGLTYSVTSVSNVSYTWNLPAGWTQTAGENTNSITVTAGTAGGTITVTPNNACGAGTPSALPVGVSVCALPPEQGGTLWENRKYVGASAKRQTSSATCSTFHSARATSLRKRQEFHTDAENSHPYGIFIFIRTQINFHTDVNKFSSV